MSRKPRLSRRLVLLVERELGMRSLYEFVRLSWSQVEPSAYVDGRHVEEICRHLEALAHRRVRRLAIAIPPGFSKSLLCCVFWPVWVWMHNPGARFMFASVDLTLAKRDALRAKALVESAWFQARWGDRLSIDHTGERADGALEHYTTAGGLRFTTSVGSRAVGWHVDYQVCDDPIKPLEASPTTCGEARDWWQGTMASRRRDPATFCRLIVQQRVHSLDLVALAIEQGYECLILPLEYDPTRYELPASDPLHLRKTSVGGDWRTEPGELLCPARIGPSELPDVQREAGAHYGTQYNQSPRASRDRLLTREALRRRWRALPPGGTHTWSWDLRFGRKEDAGSWVVGQCWYHVGVDSYLVEERRGRWGFEASKNAILEGVRARPGVVLIERAANGEAVEDSLRHTIPGIVMVPPRGGKVVRASAVVPFLSHVLLPEGAAWLDAWLTEVEQFPSEPNDRGDAMTQYLAWRYLPETGARAGASPSAYRERLRSVRRR